MLPGYPTRSRRPSVTKGSKGKTHTTSKKAWRPGDPQALTSQQDVKPHVLTTHTRHPGAGYKSGRWTCVSTKSDAYSTNLALENFVVGRSHQHCKQVLSRLQRLLPSTVNCGVLTFSFITRSRSPCPRKTSCGVKEAQADLLEQQCQ